ncbi:uncharacterized protein LOC132160974 [Carassius carassius]|nr:uncharacterized protein LOC132160974 [Carassius carassius]
MDLTALRNVQPNRACWMHPQSSDQIKMIKNALNEKESQQQFLAQVGATILDRSDFITLGHPNDVEGTILNACLSVVRDIADLKNIKVHCFSSYVTVTWLPPFCADPSANLPEHIARCDFILLPSWATNHWMICIMKPKSREMYLLDSLYGTDFSDCRFIGPYRKLAQQLHPGPWKEYGRDDLKGAPRQNCSNNCGVFVLMYTLYVVMGGLFDFAESDMAAVRRWWCLLLLTNYPVK